MGIHRYADDAAGDDAFELVFGGEEGSMRAAVAHRHSEALRIAHDGVGAPLTGGHKQGQAQEVGGHGHIDVVRMGFFHECAVIFHGAVSRGVL